MLIWLFELIDRYCQDVKPRLLTTGPASLHNSLISVLKPTGIIMRIRLITKHSLHEEGGRCEPCPLPSMIQLEHFLLCSVHRCMQLSGRLRVGPGSQPGWGGGGGGGGGGDTWGSQREPRWRRLLTDRVMDGRPHWVFSLTITCEFFKFFVINSLFFSCTISCSYMEKKKNKQFIEPCFSAGKVPTVTSKDHLVYSLSINEFLSPPAGWLVESLQEQGFVCVCVITAYNID